MDGIVSSTSPDANGRTVGEALLSEGNHQLELYVEDTEGAIGVDSVSIQVREPNEAPTCGFVAPEDGSAVQVGEVIRFKRWCSTQTYPAIS